MSANSPIEWTTHSFNPWWGCTKVSPGCDHCYAENLAQRFGTGWGPDARRRTFGDKHWNEPLKWNAKASRDHDTAKRAGVGDDYRRPRVFCASMADVFDKDAPEGVRERLWKLIEDTPALDWLLLTKRVGNVLRMVPAEWQARGFPPNVWLGISVVNQEEADRDIPKLLALPARVRFLSCEPLLGPIVLKTQRCCNKEFGMCAMLPRNGKRIVGTCAECGATDNTISWVIVGGESGHGARAMHPEWARLLREQCVAAGVPFFFKQWGEWMPIGQQPHGDAEGGSDFPGYASAKRCVLQLDGSVRDDYPPGAMLMRSIGKKAAGRLLDGRTWDELPK